MKKRTLITIAIVAVVAVAIFLKTGPLGKKVASYTFETVRVEKGRISNTVTATGTVEAITSVNVGTQVSGIIQKVYVDFNDNVKQGQLLAKLDETALRAQLDQSQSTVDQAQAELTYQESTYNRLKTLYEKKLIAQTDYDQALYNFQRSKASLANAKSAYDRTKVNLDYATIFSPIDGVVLNRAVEEGQTVAASFNTPTLFTIVNDLTQMEVQTSVDEADIGKVKVNQRVEFTVDAYPDDKFTGSVSELRLQPVTTNNVVTYVVILSAPNPDKKLMPGMTASATIYVEEKENTLFVAGKALRFAPDTAYLRVLSAGIPQGSPQTSQSIPSEAIAQNLPEGISLTGKVLPQSTVWVKDNSGGIRPVVVTTGIDNGSTTEILSGLNEGAEVVFAMTGGPVKPSAATSRGMFPRP
jgi:HlyD family secretion protein